MKKKVLNEPTEWKKLFIESFNTGFDLNGRWSKMPKNTES